MVVFRQSQRNADIFCADYFDVFQVHFYETPRLREIKHKIHLQKVAQVALAPSGEKDGNLNVAAYVPGSKVCSVSFPRGGISVLRTFPKR